MEAYSEDLRNKIVAAVDRGESREEIARMFQVAHSTIKRYLKQRRETGSLARKPIPGRPAKVFGPLREHLGAQLEDAPDITLEQRCERWEHEHGQKVSPASVSRVIKELDWTRKKSL